MVGIDICAARKRRYKVDKKVTFVPCSGITGENLLAGPAPDSAGGWYRCGTHPPDIRCAWDDSAVGRHA